jgi:uncharacterized membrane protein YhaH (DUF805 family)
LQPDSRDSGRRRIVLAALMISGSIIILAPFLTNTWAIMVLLTISRALTAAAIAINLALLMDLVRRADTGKVTGFTLLGGALGAMLGSFVTGPLSLAHPNIALAVAGAVTAGGALSAWRLTRNPVDPTREPVLPADTGNPIARCFARYVIFYGRARRSEYWYFALLVAVVDCAFQVSSAAGNLAISVLTGGALLAVALPSLAVSVRRLHDIDRSGWWLLIQLIPIIGTIIVIVWHCTPGTKGPNRFGAPRLS